MDGNVIQQTPLMVFFNLCVLVMIFLLMKKSLKYPYVVNNINRNVSIFLIFIFILYSFWGRDWFHYWRLYPKLLDGDSWHMEEIYVWIAQNLSWSYVSFRFFVWGVGFILFLVFINRISISKDLAILMFGCIWLIWFSFGRVSLSMVLCFLGIVLFYKPYKVKFFSYLLGLALIIISLFCHKSAFFVIGIAFLSFLFGRVNRKIFIMLSIFFVGILFFALKNIIPELILEESENSDAYGGMILYSAQRYMEREIGQSGIGALLAKLLERLPYYLIALQCCRVFLRKDYKNIPIEIRFFFQSQFLIVIISSVFLFNFGVNLSTIYSRFMHFSLIPNVVVLAFLWRYKIFFKMTKFIFVLAFIGTMYVVLYTLYCSFVNEYIFRI